MRNEPIENAAADANAETDQTADCFVATNYEERDR